MTWLRIPEYLRLYQQCSKNLTSHIIDVQPSATISYCIRHLA